MGEVEAPATTIEPASYVHGAVRVPGDKSVSHRYALLAALADGRSTIRGYAPGADCASTLSCLEALGVGLTRRAGELEIEGRGCGGLAPPAGDLDAGNSGTTMRLLAGILAGHPFECRITGDASLRRRPMRRVVDPLTVMGAQITTVDGRPPLTVTGGRLQGALVEPEVASAQVKSAVLLAGLHASGDTWVREPAATRDHTERALPHFGVTVHRRPGAVGVTGPARLVPATVTVPGDLSSAAFWMVAAAGLPGSSVTLEGLGLNPSRTRLLEVLGDAGARVTVEPTGEPAGEPVGTVHVAHDRVRPLVVTAADVPALIDELPALAALATFGGQLQVTGAGELRAKESDRIAVLVEGLRRLGVRAEEYPDGFRVDGSIRATGGTVDAAGDHRMAMAFAIVALGAREPTCIHGHDAVGVSYPGFFDTLDVLARS